ncbi:ArsR/SmtB family transcription factor [Streptomyces sp. NPDC056086]
MPVTLIDPSLPPVLVYPLAPEPGWCSTPGSRTRHRTLGKLLGPTRAACLRVIEDGCTTGELARRLGVAPPTASEHATVLREAGLITSIRTGSAVLHTLVLVQYAVRARARRVAGASAPRRSPRRSAQLAQRARFTVASGAARSSRLARSRSYSAAAAFLSGAARATCHRCSGSACSA